MYNMEGEKTIWHEKCKTKKNSVNTDIYKWKKN